MSEKGSGIGGVGVGVVGVGRGRQKKDWGRCWEGLVAMGVAFVIEFTQIPEPNLSHYNFANWLPLSTTPTKLTS